MKGGIWAKDGRKEEEKWRKVGKERRKVRSMGEETNEGKKKGNIDREKNSQTYCQIHI